MMTTGKYLCLIGLLLALLYPVPSYAQVTFYVRADGDKAFIIEGADVQDTANVEIKVLYDPNLLANPRVSKQWGTVIDIFDSIPGTLIFSANQGDNPTSTFEARLNFDRTGDPEGGILSVTGKIMEEDGTIAPSRTLPSPSTPSVFTAAANEAEGSAAAEESAADDSPELPLKSGQSVLQRFKAFRGKRGLKAFAALFDRHPGNMPIQEPAVVLSDGKTLVRITLPPELEEGDTPDIALSDAKLVHLGKEGGKAWVVTALPNEGTWNAGLIVKTPEGMTEFPLVVAPPVKISKVITERNFLAELDGFISDHLGAGKGEHEPLRHIPYEYVFTANYLASSGSLSPKIASEKAGLTDSFK